MAKSTPAHGLNDKVFLIGYDPEDRCVYRALLSVSDYYDGEHPWDSKRKSQALRLRRLHGHIFDEEGKLVQEFETLSNAETGVHESGWSRDETGRLTEG